VVGWCSGCGGDLVGMGGFVYCGGVCLVMELCVV
jgi:hypothetical protein